MSANGSTDGAHAFAGPAGDTGDTGAEVPSPLRARACDPDVLPLLAARAGLYAVVDAAGRPEVYAHLRDAGADAAESLYAGVDGEVYAGVAPWLVRADAACCAWIEASVAAEPGWGLFVLSRAPRAAVRRQLRRLLTVRLPDGDLARFRFYDPRVLPPFLDVCTPHELDFVFGPVDGYGVRDEWTGRLTVWDRAHRPALLPQPRLALRPAVAAPAVVVVPSVPSGDDARTASARETGSASPASAPRVEGRF